MSVSAANNTASSAQPVLPLMTSFTHPQFSCEIGLRVFSRREGKAGLPLVVYFHGGTFDCGSIEDADDIAHALAAHAVVVAVDYPLTSETHFPETTDIAFEALQWAHAHADDWAQTVKMSSWQATRPAAIWPLQWQ